MKKNASRCHSYIQKKGLTPQQIYEELVSVLRDAVPSRWWTIGVENFDVEEQLVNMQKVLVDPKQSPTLLGVRKMATPNKSKRESLL